MTNDDNAAIKRQRAIRSAVATILAAASVAFFTGLIQLPPLGVLDTLQLGKLTGMVLFGMSLWAGFQPGRETWFGDQRIYVDEPEVNDGWEY